MKDQLKADPFQIGGVLKNPKRFVVPIYQRTYARFCSEPFK
jgi:hypothetical protein